VTPPNQVSEPATPNAITYIEQEEHTAPSPSHREDGEEEGLLGEEPQQALLPDDDAWPEWYRDLWALPNFKKPLKECEAWLEKNKIPVALATSTAAALYSKWDKKKWKDVWATFRNWCLMALRRAGTDGAGSQRGRRPQPPKDYATSGGFND